MVDIIVQEQKSDGHVESYLTPHQTEDRDVFREVLCDLVTRFPDMKITRRDSKATKPFFDFGGMAIVGLSYDEKGPVGFHVHQADMVLSALKKHRDKIRVLGDLRYAKIPTAYSMVCIRESTLLAALADLEARIADLTKQADDEFKAFINKAHARS